MEVAQQPPEADGHFVAGHVFGHVVGLPALSTNIITLRKGELGTPLSGREAASLTLNHFCASSSKVSTRHGRLDSFVLASLHSAYLSELSLA